MQVETKNRIVANWLFIGVGMIIFQIILGGITRLTGSGLSITEWKPILGALPPLNETDWKLAFNKYKQIGQYRFINSDFSLAQFKFIYFWEWLHRNWARFMSLVFLIPFVYFFVKKYFTKSMLLNFIGIFLIGALQGAIGWIMVASGVNPDDVYVSHIKLALHFMAALLLLVFIYWFALKLSYKEITVAMPKFRNYILVVIVLLVLQLTYGAFVAGLKAASIAPTWPLINGEIIPSKLFTTSWLYNSLIVQFIHRSIGYSLFVLILVGYILHRKNAVFGKNLSITLLLVCLQIALGIFSLLLSTKKAVNSMGSFEWSALLHQLCAIFLLLSIIRLLFISNATKEL